MGTSSHAGRKTRMPIPFGSSAPYPVAPERYGGSAASGYSSPGNAARAQLAKVVFDGRATAGDGAILRIYARVSSYPDFCSHLYGITVG